MEAVKPKLIGDAAPVLGLADAPAAPGEVPDADEAVETDAEDVTPVVVGGTRGVVAVPVGADTVGLVMVPEMEKALLDE